MCLHFYPPIFQSLDLEEDDLLELKLKAPLRLVPDALASLPPSSVFYVGQSPFVNLVLRVNGTSITYSINKVATHFAGSLCSLKHYQLP